MLEEVKDKDSLFNLFKKELNYMVDPIEEYIELPDSAIRLLKTPPTLISDYKGEGSRFRIYHAEVSSLRRSDFRTILEPFYKRYPQVNALFVFTSDDSNSVCFVSPQRLPGTEPGKTKLRLRVLEVDPQNVYRTDREIIENIRLSPGEKDPEHIWQKHLEAFNVERVTDRFFDDYKKVLDSLKTILSSKKKVSIDKVHAFAQQFLNRLMFIYFIQKKGWMKWEGQVSDKRYIRNLWGKYGQTGVKDSFYSVWLSSLFFGAFNRKFGFMSSNLPQEIKNSLRIMPYLNGGLFDPKEGVDDLGFDIPDSFFDSLFDYNSGLLERYNFTIDESKPLEVEVAVDPEMLGRVYESLIAQEEQHKSGIFYTPREEIDYMCRLSLIEYLKAVTRLDKSKIIDFVMTPSDIIASMPQDEARRVRTALDSVRVVDPAVGSASFLVGMMNALLEIHESISEHLREPMNRFALKKKFIRENLYGVDVKDWAVRVGELRLWLTLIVESDEKEMDIYNSPLLPNLSFRLRQGDSLVEEIGSISFSLRSDYVKVPAHIKKEVSEIADMKSKFYSGIDGYSQRAIEKRELDLLKKIIDAEVKKIDIDLATTENEIKGLTGQGKLAGITELDKPKTKKLIEEYENKKEDLRSQRERLFGVFNSISKKGEKDFFFWDIDFAEVFDEKGGFDIVIGNPPYVRQEEIAPPLENKDSRDADTWRSLKRDYKDKLERSVKTHWGSIKIDRKSDLYVYFYYHGLALLRPGGVFSFINSNSWLDVGYGAGLQDFLLRNMKVLQIIDNHAERSFARADVNTVIVLIQRPKDEEKKSIWDNVVRFVAYKKPFEEVIKPETQHFIAETNGEVRAKEELRVYPVTQKGLFLEGVEIEDEQKTLDFDSLENLEYRGGKWGGKYLRAPAIFFTILEKGKGKLVRLGDIAEVRRGFTTGANEFFYLEPVEMSVSDAVRISEKKPDSLIPVENGAGWRGEIEAEFLKPVIKSPREIRTIKVRLEDLRYLVFMCHLSKEELRNQGKSKALRYIEWGEKQGYHRRPTCASRGRWWDLGEWTISKSILPMFERERKYCFYNDVNAYIDNALYWVYKKVDTDDKILNLSLNSVLIGLWKELLCRPPEGGGGGPIQMKVYHYDEMPIPPIEKLSFSSNLINSFINKEIPTLFEELGSTLCRNRSCTHPEHPYELVNPSGVSLDKVMPDRRELDRVVFEALGLTEEEQIEVYRAVVELVKNRLVKARSV